MEQTYRISSWRFDIVKNTHSTPKFEGDSIEECDKKALEHFLSISNDPQNAWDGMDIVRIDSPAVAEKTTFLTANGRQSGNDEYSL